MYAFPSRKSNSISLEEFQNFSSNLLYMILQRKMTTINEMYLRIRKVLLECLGAGRYEDNIILSPDCEER